MTEHNSGLGNGDVPDRYSNPVKRDAVGTDPAVSHSVPEIKDVNLPGLEFIAKEEGLKLKPYRDSRGIPTIGVGATYYANGKRVTMQDRPLTKEQALALFKWHLDIYEKGVWSVTRDDINQNQFNALVSLCFNIGVSAFKGSTVLSRVNTDPSDQRIMDAFKMWKRSGDDPDILLARRIREATLYFS